LIVSTYRSRVLAYHYIRSRRASQLTIRRPEVPAAGAAVAHLSGGCRRDEANRAPSSIHPSSAQTGRTKIAAGRERGTSDIDVFVVGSVTFSQVVGALLPCQDEVGREVNPVVMDVAEFRRRATGDDVFLRDVLGGDKIFLIGGEDDLARLAQ